MASREAGILANYGVGDHVILASLAQAVARSRDCEVVIAGRPEFAFLANIFLGVGRFVVLPPECQGKELGLSEVAVSQWVYGHFRGMELARAVGYAGFRFLDAYRCLLDLPENAAPECPLAPSADEISRATATLRSRGHEPGRCIYLSGEARSTPITPAIRELLARVPVWAARRGLTVFGNSWSDGSMLPLAELRSLVACSAGYVAARSGICDLLAGLETPGVVLFSRTRYLGGMLFAGTKISDFGFPYAPLEFEEPSWPVVEVWLENIARRA